MASIALFAELDEARFQLANFSSAFLWAAMLL
jgi:predicted DNA-binding ribbon-helix-helix protein